MNCFNFNTNNDFNEINFFTPYNTPQTNYTLFFKEDEEQYKHDELASLTDIKSTEEMSSKGSNSLSIIAEDNAPINEEAINVVSYSNDFDNMTADIQFKINNGSIESLIDEALDNIFDGNIEKFRPIQHKKKKTSAQNQYLEQALKENREWEKPFMVDIAGKLGLKYRQIYKWYWDKIKKSQKGQEKKSLKVKHNKFEDIESAFSSLMN